MREFDLRIPAAIWLRDRGLIPIMEMHSMGNCDITGVSFEKNQWLVVRRLTRIVAIELKLRDKRGVIAQAQNHRERAHETWCVMPEAAVSSGSEVLFSEAGVGLLLIREGFCKIVIPSPEYVPRDPQRILRTAWRRREEYLDRMKDKWMRRKVNLLPKKPPHETVQAIHGLPPP